jgi:hypothetical protein
MQARRTRRLVRVKKKRAEFQGAKQISVFTLGGYIPCPVMLSFVDIFAPKDIRI